MLIDDARGTLAALREFIKEERKAKSGLDLNVGDIVYQNLDRDDGLVLTGDYDTRLKYFVIVGKNESGDLLGICLINSDLDFYKKKPQRQKYQYVMKQGDYPDILEKDSRLDCTTFLKIDVAKSVDVEAEIVGHLTEDDKKYVFQLIADCGFISKHDKKVFNII